MSDWKPHNKTLKILKDCETKNYGVLATIAYNLDMVMAMIKAAENKRSPLIIQFFPWAIQHSNGDLIRAAALLAQRASVPVAIHLDHCQDPELVKLAATTLPFDSIMIDMSHYEEQENLAKTKELVALCNQHHMATEAEPGRINGGEDGISDTADLEGILTTPQKARLFVDSGIDILSPAFGNFHGNYPPSGPQLRFDIVDKLDVPIHLCVHGTNGFSPDLILKIVQHGFSKINVNHLVLDTHLEYFQANADQVPLTELLETSRDILIKRMEYWMDACGSTGKSV